MLYSQINDFIVASYKSLSFEILAYSLHKEYFCLSNPT